MLSERKVFLTRVVLGFSDMSYVRVILGVALLGVALYLIVTSKEREPLPPKPE